MSEDVKKLAEDIMCYALRERDYRGYLRNYLKSKRYYRGKHDIKMQYPHAHIYNKASEIVKNRIAHLMDAELKWQFFSQESSDIFITRAIQQILSDVIWDYIEWDSKKEDLFFNAAFAGTGWIKTVVDNNGWPNFIVVPTKSILTDKARSIKDSRFIVHLVALNVKEIKRRYGVDIAPESNIYFSNYSEDEEGFYDTGNYKMPVPTISSGSDEDYNVNERIGKAIVAEIWMDDPTMVPIKFDKEEFQKRVELIEAGQKPPVSPLDNHPRYIQEYRKLLDKYSDEEDAAKAQIIEELINEHSLYPQETKVPKYPRGRIITICQGKVLRDIPNPLPLHWKDIWIPMKWFDDPDSVWGKPLLEDVFELQDALNEGDKLIRDNTNVLTAGFIKVRWQLYKKLGNKLKFDSIARKVLPFIAPDDIQVDFGKALPAHYYANVSRYEDSMDKVSGYTDIMAGRFPTGSPPGITVNQLLTEGKAIIRLILRHYAVALEKMAMNAIILMNEYMSEDEKFEIIGEDNQPQLIDWGTIKTKLDVMKNIRIRVATQMPSTKAEKMKHALELYQAGVYTRRAVLEEIDDPKKFSVIRELDEIETLKQLVQQLATENDELKKQLNTVLNRLQNEYGIGNVGVPTRG